MNLTFASVCLRIPILWLAVTLLCALPCRASADPTKPASATSPEASDGDCHMRDGKRLLLDYFAPAPAPAAATTDAASSATPEAELQRILQRGDTQLEFLLATVPEPRLGFDGTVEAITRALEATGYTLDRYYLPWDSSSEKRRAGCQMDYPGVALFMRSPDPSLPSDPRRIILLHLVGESPIAGIHKPSFVRAVEEIKQLRTLVPSARCPSCDKLRILGPAFSGAAASLEQLLDRFPTDNFQILSGRATNAAIQPLLTRHSSKSRSVTFQATVIPDEAMQAEFFCYLTETLGANEHDIALVTESSTAYGQAVIAQNADAGLGDSKHHASVLPERSPPPLVSQLCRRPHRPRLMLPVPMHISRVHTALAKSAMDLGRSEMSDAKSSSPLPKLLDDTTRSDLFPTLSERAVAAADRALSHILSTIFAEKIRYVGVLATDVQDKLFLLYQIRKYCPDVVLFTFESDLLYTHPEARSFLKGMLVVSPYPLFTRNQQWSYPYQGWHNRLQFSSAADEGVYNATVALLGYPEHLLEYSQASPGVGTGVPQSRPAIWISAVGNDTLFPLAFLKDYSDRGYVYQNLDTGHGAYLYSPYQQGTLSLLLLFLGIAGVVCCLGYFRVYYGGRECLPLPWSIFRVLRPYSMMTSHSNSSFGQREADRQPLFMMMLFAPIFIGYFLLTALHFIQLRDGNLDPFLNDQSLPLWMRVWYHIGHIGIYQGLSWRVLGVGMLAALCQLVFSLTVLDLALNYFFRSWRVELQQRILSRIRKLPQRRKIVFYVGTALLGIMAVWLLFALFVGLVNSLQHDFNAILLMRRSAQPAYGLSPLVPLLLLGLGIQLWGYCNLERIRLLSRLATVYLDLIDELTDAADLRDEIARIAEQLCSPSRGRVILSILCSCALMTTLFSELVTLEHAPLHLVFRFLFSLLFACIGYAFFQFVKLFRAIRDFLQMLGHHPIADAIDRMPFKLSRSLSVLLLEDLPERTRRESEHQHYHLIMNHLAQLSPERDLINLRGEQTLVQTLRTKILDFAALRAGLEQEELQAAPHASEAEHKDAHQDSRMVKMAQLVIEILKLYWRARPLPGVVAGTEKPSAQAAQPALSHNRNTADFYLTQLPDSLHLWLRLCEDFIAVQVVAYIARLFPHLRNLLLFVTLGFIGLLTASISYPFQPQHFLSLLVWMQVLVTGPMTLWILVQLNRDEILSRIAKSEPGKLTWDRHFISQIVLYGVLPLLSLIATQFPEVRGFAFSWLETLLKTLK